MKSSRWSAATAGVLLASVPAAPHAVAQPAPRPNVVFILADDLGIGDIGAYGQQTIQTPRLDALAAGGMTFSNMYSGAPVCSPSRAVLFSGMHNGRFNNGNGVSLPGGMPTTASTLRDAGYATGLFGKLHLGGANRLWGFDEFYGLTDGVEAWDHFNPWLQRGVAGPDGRIDNIVQEDINGAYTDDEIAFETMRFVRDHANTGTPFYAQLNFQIAHFDLEIPEIEPYAAALDVPLQEQIHASMVTRMDRRIGELMDTLADPDGDPNTNDGVLDNTLIVFASDNGAAIEGGDLQRGTGPHDPETFNSNAETRGHKRDLYDGGIQSPFIAHWAGTIAAGSTSDAFGDFSDVLPTLASLAGTDTPAGLDGESFAHVLTGGGPELPLTRADRYYEFTGGFFFNPATGDNVGPSTASPPRTALIRDGFKAIRFADGHTEFYDLANDPSEANDLFAQNQALANGMIADALDQNTGLIAYPAWNEGGEYFDQNFGWSTGVAPRRGDIARIDSGTVYAEFTDEVLGLDLGNGTDPAGLTVVDGSIFARNGARVNANAELRLDQEAFSTLRRVELAGGALVGNGLVVGQVVNRGTLSPDRFTVTPPTRSVPTPAVVFDFAGIQDDAPLTQTSILSPSLQLVAGFDFGPSTQPRSAGPDGLTSTDAGDEFNVGGFDTSSLSQAIGAGDFLTYTVQPVPGFELLLDRVGYTLWRNGVNAANDYAILTSIDGFTVGNELAQLNNLFDSGEASARTFTGVYTGEQAVTDPLEVRLYAWNANDNLASTHITDVWMDATFALIGGATANIGEASAGGVTPDNPYGVLTLQGGYFQQSGGTLVFDIGGVDAGSNADRFLVVGDAELAGTLDLRTDDAYVPTLGQRARVVEIGGDPGHAIVGVFDEVIGVLRDGYAWAVTYQARAAWAEAALRGDANLNGQVEQGDLDAVLQNWGQTSADGVSWVRGDLNGNGTVEQGDLDQVLQNWGGTTAPDLSAFDVPEPAAAATVLGMLLASRRR